MALPKPQIIAAGQSALRRMADRDTPFITSCWYVAALAEEISDGLFKRRILDQQLVLYRTSEGKVVALEDRCAHRSFPLSSGRLEGDTIICGYHGFRYDPNGNWIDVPSQTQCPKGVGVRNYPIVQQGPLLWIWMGDSPADESLLPAQEWMASADWAFSVGYMPLRGNYVSLHENLLDLTHLSYLHAGTFGTPDYARAPFDAEVGETSFAVTRRVVPTQLPHLWAKATNLEGTTTAARIARSAFVSPGLHVTSVDFYESTLPQEERPEYHIKVAHLPTPERHDATHYFFVIARDFGLEDHDLQAFIHQNLLGAFQEDKDGLEKLEDVLRQRKSDFFEISVASDAASVAMRRYLKKTAEAEQY
jgi:phenylpropionate dioxygenase-like ring-hydroxylating dioxygenase large terminal subunit